jgi:hypothetical protein
MMTDDMGRETTPPGAEALPDEPIPDAAEGGTDGSGGARAREWLAQLEAMIQEIATQAAPVARQVGAKAAELTAVAAAKAGPIAQKAAEKTSDVGQRLAERAQSVAAELRADQATAEPTPDEGATVEPAAEADDAQKAGGESA